MEKTRKLKWINKATTILDVVFLWCCNINSNGKIFKISNILRVLNSIPQFIWKIKEILQEQRLWTDFSIDIIIVFSVWEVQIFRILVQYKHKQIDCYCMALSRVHILLLIKLLIRYLLPKKAHADWACMYRVLISLGDVPILSERR